MVDFFKLILPLFLSVENYDKMRQKLASFVFYEVYIASFFIRRMSEYGSGIKAFEKQIFGAELMQKYEILNAINPIGIIIAFLVATITYIFHFHDRVSDLFGIRRRFDRNVIIKRLADETGINLDAGKWASIISNHDRVMSNVYYKYTSSTAPNPVVDRHDIAQALDAWTWFWIALEGSVIWAIGVFLSLQASSERGAIWFGFLLAGYLLGMLFLQPLLKRRAFAQVEKIADDHNAKLAVTGYLNAL